MLVPYTIYKKRRQKTLIKRGGGHNVIEIVYVSIYVGIDRNSTPSTDGTGRGSRS